jgi:site-specific DNA recombinase
MSAPQHIPSTGAQIARRCAIYTRRAASVGAQLNFNSLEAQYKSCLAYIDQQPGWSLEARFDDDGFSGLRLDRPSLKRLLASIEAGQIDVVVVYQLERLSRSLLDMTRLIERFDATGTVLISTTQHFSTAHELDRLQLKSLMSFTELAE